MVANPAPLILCSGAPDAFGAPEALCEREIRLCEHRTHGEPLLLKLPAASRRESSKCKERILSY